MSATGRSCGRVVAGVALVLLLLVAGVGVVDARVAADSALANSAVPRSAGWSDGACPDASGVTVAVDFQGLGGGTAVRCAPGPVADGFDALGRAGIAVQTATRYPGFLCRIAGEPSSDPCITAAPATAYWSYWLAARGGPWCYSNLGAGNRRPPAGTVEGWSFSLSSDGTTAPPPRVAVPDPIPGAAPVALGDADCDSTPPAAVPVTPDAFGPPGMAPTADPTPRAGESPTPSDAGTAPDGTATPGAVAVDGATTTIAPSTSSLSAESPDSGADAASGAAVAGASDDNGPDSEEAVRVDLDQDGRTGDASPLGVALASTLIGALGVGAVVVRRRAAHR